MEDESVKGLFSIGSFDILLEFFRPKLGHTNLQEIP